MTDLIIDLFHDQKDQYKIKVFRMLILNWYSKNKRNFPWRNKNISPYQKIIAEIFLQKTKAENILEVYEKFLNYFPTIEELATADRNTIEKIIKPLGLYKRRSKLLIQFAKCVLNNFYGQIPTEQKELLKIPGIGLYIGNIYLISQFDYRLPVVDTNFKRIYSRVFSVSMEGDPRRNSFLLEFAEYMLPETNVRDYTFGILDFAALLCKGRNPECEMCPMNHICDYYKNIINV